MAYINANELIELEPSNEQAIAIRQSALYSLNPMKRRYDLAAQLKAKAEEMMYDGFTSLEDVEHATGLLTRSLRLHQLPGTLFLRARLYYAIKRYRSLVVLIKNSPSRYRYDMTY